MTERDTMTDLLDAPELEDPPADVEQIDGLLDSDEPTGTLAWAIDGTATAEWAMRKLAAARRRIGEIEDTAARWHARIDAWAARESRRPLRTEQFMADRLAAYAVSRRREDPKAKTLTLPSGVVRTKEVHATVEPDPQHTDELLAWLASTAEEVRRTALTQPTVSRSGLRKVVEIVDTGDGVTVVCPATGEVVPGVRVVDGGVTAMVTVDNGEPF